MTAYGSECFTMNEVNRLKILQDVIDGRLTTSLASQRLGLTDRHCRRLLARYRESGPLALVNRRRGLRSNRQLLPGLAELALGIIRDNYADFGPTLACEKLAELHDVVQAKETVHQLMVRAGLWIPRKMRAPRIQQPRYRRACVVEECLRCRDAAAPLGLTECQVQRLNDSRDSQGLSTSTLALLSSPLMICKVLSRPIS